MRIESFYFKDSYVISITSRWISNENWKSSSNGNNFIASADDESQMRIESSSYAVSFPVLWRGKMMNLKWELKVAGLDIPGGLLHGGMNLKWELKDLYSLNTS